MYNTQKKQNYKNITQNACNLEYETKKKYYKYKEIETQNETKQNKQNKQNGEVNNE